MLHHRQQMAEMLAVMPAPPAEDRPLVGRHLELRLGQHRRRSPRDIRPRSCAGRARSRARSALRAVSSTSNNSGTKRQHQSSPSAIRRALSSVPSPSRIVQSRGQLAVIGDFLDRLGGDRAAGTGRWLSPARGKACAARSRTATAARWSARNRHWAARPAGNSCNRARRGVNASSSPSPFWPCSRKCVACPIRSSARLARLRSTSSAGACPHHSPSRWPRISAVVAQPQQIIVIASSSGLAAPRRRRRTPRRSGAFSRVLAPGPSRSPAATASDVLHHVGNVVEGRVAIDLVLGRLEQRPASAGSLTRRSSADGTTHRLTPSCRRV